MCSMGKAWVGEGTCSICSPGETVAWGARLEVTEDAAGTRAWFLPPCESLDLCEHS